MLPDKEGIFPQSCKITDAGPLDRVTPVPLHESNGKGKNNGDQSKYAETDKVRCNKGVGHQISFGLTA